MFCLSPVHSRHQGFYLHRPQLELEARQRVKGAVSGEHHQLEGDDVELGEHVRDVHSHRNPALVLSKGSIFHSSVSPHLGKYVLKPQQNLVLILPLGQSQDLDALRRRASEVTAEGRVGPDLGTDPLLQGEVGSQE